MSITSWVLALVITAGAASIQGTVGIGFGMVSVPILSLIDPQLAPVPQLIIALPLTVSMTWTERTSIEPHGFWWIIVGRIPGGFAGVALLAIASQQTLDIFIGIVVLAAVAVLATGTHVKRTRMTKFLAGVASGTTGVVASIGGPPVALLYSSAEARIIRSTLAGVFTIGILLSIAFRFGTGHITGTDLRVSAVLLPAAIAGYMLSVVVKDKVPAAGVRIGILAISAAASVALLIRAVAA